MPDPGSSPEPRKRGRQGGKVCSTCGQYAMLFELRDHGRACSYCTPVVPDAPEGAAIMDSTHKLALDEDRRRRRAARRAR